MEAAVMWVEMKYSMNNIEKCCKASHTHENQKYDDTCLFLFPQTKPMGYTNNDEI